MSKPVACIPTWFVIRFFMVPHMYVEVIRADLIIAGGDQVPEIMLKDNWSSGDPTGVGHAARMLTPGATMSGFRIPGLAVLGPLEEKYAIAGVNGPPVTAPLKTMVAVALLLDAMYCLITNPA
ncbi:unnamed protein product [Spirodela intermedia]|uniref:Uncharacterized protein n=1 Tax=Spirodela intermedia TaxID=51605 RepID=A0A7I8LB17_SPIIN|nr:unnamed protein product [Spirodela intermedia]